MQSRRHDATARYLWQDELAAISSLPVLRAAVPSRGASYLATVVSVPARAPWVAAAVQALIANAVGTGIKPRSAHPDAMSATRCTG
jgi:hypothetical protein